MSVYKEPFKWIKQSIYSIIQQTFTDFEFIIICDNPSNQNLVDFLELFSKRDRRIKLIVNENNLGLTRSLNKGLEYACGKYIARMDADDISLPLRFQKQVEFLEQHPNVIVLGTSYSYIGKGASIRTSNTKCDDESIRAQMLLTNCIAHSSVFIRRSVLVNNNIVYDETYRQSQDYRLWELLFPYGEFACLNEKLLNYRLSSQQITKTEGSKQSHLAMIVRTRLQHAWLSRCGYNFPLELISDKPFKIIEILRRDCNITCTKEYKAYLSYAYLYSEDQSWTISYLIKYDLIKLSVFDTIRLLKRIIS